MSAFEMDDESKEQAFNLLKKIEKYNDKFEDKCNINLEYDTYFNEAKDYQEISTEKYVWLLTSALEDAFERDNDRLKKLEKILKCGCGKVYKEPYNKCYECLMKQRKSQSVCKCGKYFNKEGQNGAIYKMCYNCNMKQKE